MGVCVQTCVRALGVRHGTVGKLLPRRVQRVLRCLCRCHRMFSNSAVAHRPTHAHMSRKTHEDLKKAIVNMYVLLIPEDWVLPGELLAGGGYNLTAEEAENSKTIDIKVDQLWHIGCGILVMARRPTTSR